MIVEGFSILLFIIFVLLSILHFYWSAGGRWKLNGVLPANKTGEYMMTPSFFSCVCVGLLLMLFGFYYFPSFNAKISHFFPWLKLLNWIIPSIFLLRILGDFKYVGIFKQVRHTQFSRNDTLYYIPLCLLISILGFYLAKVL